MKPIIFLLLLSTGASQVIAQQDKPGDDVLPPRQKPAAGTTITSVDVACPHCNKPEQLVVDLIYYKQVLDILEQIDQQRGKINSGLLQSVHAELIKTRPNLAALLKANNKPPARPAPVQKKAAKPVKKPVKTVKKPARKQGIEGLIVGHVNEANEELGIKPSVVLISNGQPRSLNVGGAIEHNQRSYKVVKVNNVEDPKKGNRHEVHLQEQTSKKIQIVPWK